MVEGVGVSVEAACRFGGIVCFFWLELALRIIRLCGIVMDWRGKRKDENPRIGLNGCYGD